MRGGKHWDTAAKKVAAGLPLQDMKVQHWEEVSPRDPFRALQCPGIAAHWDKLMTNSPRKGLAIDKHGGCMVSDCPCRTAADVKCSSSESERSVTCVFVLC